MTTLGREVAGNGDESGRDMCAASGISADELHDPDQWIARVG